MSQDRHVASLGSIEVMASDRGLIFQGAVAAFKSLEGVEPRFSSLVCMLPLWKQMGLAEASDTEFLIPLEGQLALEDRAAANEYEVDFLELLLPWSDLAVDVRAKGLIGYDNFEISCCLKDGTKKVLEKPLGTVVFYGDRAARLRTNVSKVFKLAYEFNAQSASQRADKRAGLLAVRQLKELAKGGYVVLDPVFKAENVVVVDKFKLGLTADDDEATFYPVVEGVPEEDFRRHFLNRTGVDRIYDIGNAQHGRTRVIVPDGAYEAIKSIRQRGTRLRGPRLEDVLRNPSALIPEGENGGAEFFDLSDLGPRVRGIGIYAATARPVLRIAKETWIPECLAMEVAYADGEREQLNFSSLDDGQKFLQLAQAGLAAGQNSIQLEGRSIPLSGDLISQVQVALAALEKKEPVKRGDPKQKNILLIFENDEALEYCEVTDQVGQDHVPPLEVPHALNKGVDLKAYQKKSIAWMQSLIRGEVSRGCLLADDMGLGKTLQILVVLAWCIESERFCATLGQDGGPYEPILIVAPMTLINVWEKEMRKFFDESVFNARLILHGKELSRLKVSEERGGELDLARPTLRIQDLKKYRVILTNYETVRNYQHSLARTPLSILVLDEAQEIKEPGSGLTLAAKALNPKFRIASSGTPVENSLLNLWSLMDFIQPGSALVASQKDFLKRYDTEVEDRAKKSDELKARLGLNAPSGAIWRRLKSQELEGLPSKLTHPIKSHLSNVQVAMYQDVIKETREGDAKKGAMLKAIQALSLISQHPFLKVDQGVPSDYQGYLAVCPKLASLLEVLETVKSQGEKALIFSRSLKMQQILAAVIRGRFGLDVDIMNGSTRTGVNYSERSREGMVTRFSQVDGFNVIVLSPEVAGVGLTINEANHVLHYGRWWNPAKESQATDRAYRIGQTRPVHVYNFIAEHPTGEFETFDTKLDRLLGAKEQLAKDFLTPSSVEEQCARELVESVFGRRVDPEPKDLDDPLKASDLATISHERFEAAVALILRDEWDHVFVTPRGNDRGIDVVALKGGEVLLVQVKHTANQMRLLSQDPVDELFDGFEHYRTQVLGRFKTWKCRLLAVSNGSFPPEVKERAAAREVEIWDGSCLGKKWEAQSRSLREIEREEGARLTSLTELRTKIDGLALRGAKG